MVTSEIHRVERMKETRSVEDGWKDMRERERERASGHFMTIENEMRERGRQMKWRNGCGQILMRREGEN